MEETPTKAGTGRDTRRPVGRLGDIVSEVLVVLFFFGIVFGGCVLAFKTVIRASMI